MLTLQQGKLTIAAATLVGAVLLGCAAPQSERQRAAEQDKLLETKAWELALKENSAVGYTRYLVQHSGSPRTAEARRLRESFEIPAARAAAQSGDQIAQYKLAQMLLRNGDRSGAIDWLGRVAKQGHLESQIQLGHLEYKNHIISSARMWFQLAAEQGSQSSMYNLRAIAWNRSEYEAALTWLRKEALSQHSASQHVLAIMYWNGQGVKQDPEIATGHMRKAGLNSVDLRSIAEWMSIGAECVKKNAGFNPVLSGSGAIRFVNDGTCLSLGYNPTSLALEGDPEA